MRGVKRDWQEIHNFLESGYTPKEVCILCDINEDYLTTGYKRHRKRMQKYGSDNTDKTLDGDRDVPPEIIQTSKESIFPVLYGDYARRKREIDLGIVVLSELPKKQEFY